jgi:flagellar protein FlbD
MIKVTRLNGQLIVLNADLIEFVEEIPDTIISLTTGKKIMVQENAEQIIEKVIAFKRNSGALWRFWCWEPGEVMPDVKEKLKSPAAAPAQKVQKSDFGLPRF